MIKKLCIAFVLAVASLVSIAQETNLLHPLGTAASIQGIDGYDAGKIGYYQNLQSPDLKWAVSNWGAPVNLKAKRSFTYDWNVYNNYSRVQHFQNLNGNSHVWELAQSNVTGPCNNEVDLFLGMDVLDQNKTLATMGELTFTADLERTYTDVQVGCMNQGFWDYGEMTMAIMFVTNDPPHQILFYQVSMGITRLDYDPTDPVYPYPSWCPYYEDTDDGPQNRQYCVGDDIRNLGGVRTYEGQRTVNDLDIISRVTDIIRKGHTKQGDSNGVLETDLSKWRIGGVYFGQIVQGKVVIDSRWNNVKLKYRDGGQFCGGTQMVQWTCGAEPTKPGWINVGNACYHKPTGNTCQ